MASCPVPTPGQKTKPLLPAAFCKKSSGCRQPLAVPLSAPPNLPHASNRTHDMADVALRGVRLLNRRDLLRHGTCACTGAVLPILNVLYDVVIFRKTEKEIRDALKIVRTKLTTTGGPIQDLRMKSALE